MSINFLRRKREDKSKEHENEQKSTRRTQKRSLKWGKEPKKHAFPIWLRIVVVIVLTFISLIVGAMIGYGVIGDGAPLDALKIKTWQHIIDIVIKD